jgi:hypothetical protein
MMKAFILPLIRILETEIINSILAEEAGNL